MKVAQAVQDVAGATSVKEALEGRIAESDGKLTESEARNRRLRRKVRAVSFGIAFLVVVIALIVLGVIVHWGVVVAILSVAYYYLRARDYVESDGLQSAKIVRDASVEIVILLIAIFAGL